MTTITHLVVTDTEAAPRVLTTADLAVDLANGALLDEQTLYADHLGRLVQVEVRTVTQEVREASRVARYRIFPVAFGEVLVDFTIETDAIGTTRIVEVL